MKCLNCEHRRGLVCHHPGNRRPVRIAKNRLTTDEPCRMDMEYFVVWDLNRPWTPEEIQTIKDNWDMPMYELQTMLQRPANSIYGMRKRLRKESTKVPA